MLLTPKKTPRGLADMIPLTAPVQAPAACQPWFERESPAIADEPSPQRLNTIQAMTTRLMAVLSYLEN
jgi:hypothetical protein